MSVESYRSACLTLVNNHKLWSSDGPWLETLGELLCTLDKLIECEPPFHVVDEDLPFEVRAERLLAWCKTHPHFSCGPITLSATLEGKPRGTRGVLCTAPMPPGAPIVCLPSDLALSTDSAYVSHELGPLLDQPSLIFSSMPPLILTLHVLVEHAKALDTPPLPPSQPLPPATLPVGRPPALMAHHAATLRTLTGKASSTAMHPQDHPWGSKHRAFFACLPPRIPNCVFWSHASFLKLSHTRIAYPAARLLRDTVKSYLTLSSVLGEVVEGLAPHLTWAAFRWAQGVCMSRQNNLPSLPGTPKPPPPAAPAGHQHQQHQHQHQHQQHALGAPNTFCLLPILDMLNHDVEEGMPFFTTSPPPPVDAAAGVTAGNGGPTGNGGSTGLITACTRKGAPRAGVELGMNYGGRAAGELLMHQGFLTPGALERDGARITMHHPPTFAAGKDPLFPIKTGLLGALGVGYMKGGQPRHTARHLSELAASRGEPPMFTFSKLKEGEKWVLPFDFPIQRSQQQQPGGGGGGGGGHGHSHGGGGGHGHSHGGGGGGGCGGLGEDDGKEEGEEGSGSKKQEEKEGKCPLPPVSVIPPQLRTYARVLCLERADATSALRGSQDVLKAMEAAVTAAMAEEEGGGEGEGVGSGEEKGGGSNSSSSSSSSNGGGGGKAAGGGGGHSHGGVPCNGHHPSNRLMERELAELELPIVSPANEVAARALLASHLSALVVVAEGEVAKLEGQGGVGGVEVKDAEDHFIHLFLTSQAALLKQALAEVA